MKIYLHEITDQETSLDFTQEEKWVCQAVEKVDEQIDDVQEIARPRPARLPAARPIHAHFALRKVDDVIVVNGDVETHVELICSRCANPFQLHAHPRFSALFCKDPVMAGVGYLQNGKTAGQNKGFARHAHDEEMGTKDLDITYVSEDHIELGNVLTEQLQLEVPFQPLCQEDCKGMCTQCGADLNVGRCACAKIAKKSPFTVLQDIKIQTVK